MSTNMQKQKFTLIQIKMIPRRQAWTGQSYPAQEGPEKDKLELEKSCLQLKLDLQDNLELDEFEGFRIKLQQ